jgi:deoxycytidylate deaminase
MPEQPRNAELFIGLVARMGVDTREFSELTAELLHEYDYEVIEIKLSDVLKELKLFSDLPQSPVESRYDAYIEAGNEVRRLTQNQAAMARFAVAQIIDARANDEGGPTLLTRRAFIINQLKTRQESEFLRSVYGEHYVQISVHADYAHRETVLAKRIASEHFENPRHENWRTKAGELLDKDNAQENEPFGQRVRDVFPMSDVVVSAQEPQAMRDQIGRFLRALFGDFRITPTREEYGMQLANTASLRSADLSRQVGAAIMNDQAEVQALGCNEVPKAFGGTYWEGDGNDSREFQLGADSNDKRKREMLLDIGQKFRKAGLLKEEFSNDNLLKKSLIDRTDSIIDDAQFMDSLEYGRTVHAEMNAITDAARNGHAIRGCTLFCNTFPCHNCAKHIVASGIRRLVYLRPYPKSYASDLFDDSISIDHSLGLEDRVEFNQFIGIVGPIYERIFSKVRWKEGDGKVPRFDKSQAAFVRRNPVPAYTHIETVFREEWIDVLEEKGLIDITPETFDEAADGDNQAQTSNPKE